MSTDSLVVLGAGAWGTALAVHAAQHGVSTRLWAHEEAQVAAMERAKENAQFLPGVALPDALSLTADLNEALHEAKTVLVAIPTRAIPDYEAAFRAAQPFSIIMASKGLAPGAKRFSEFFANVPSITAYGVLSGPSFAKELAAGIPTAVTFAATDSHLSDTAQSLLHRGPLRLYTTDDIAGVELGGVLKNVLAIAVGIADGMSCGANTRAALITRGLRELQRLGTAFGAKADTLTGLSGLGDLVLTATDNQSRNRSFGVCLGQGQSVAEATQTVAHVVEGLSNTEQVMTLAQQAGVDLPICQQVHDILFAGKSATEALDALLKRDPKAEID